MHIMMAKAGTFVFRVTSVFFMSLLRRRREKSCIRFDDEIFAMLRLNSGEHIVLLFGFHLP